MNPCLRVWWRPAASPFRQGWVVDLNIDQIIEGISRSDPRSISRAISIFEDDILADRAEELIRKLYPSTGRAHIIGITGPPGVGKSTLIGRLSGFFADEGRKPGVLAIDASSPYSRGAFLGNRVRMQESLMEKGIYMRSLTNRGFKGGLSLSALGACKVLDAAGFDPIIVETVGSGQADLDIMSVAHTVAVILAPGLGDEIQAIKAGMMEIGDLFIINKTDREGAFIAMKEIQDTLALGPHGKWIKPVLGLNSLTGEGFSDLTAEIDRHWIHMNSGKDAEGRLRGEVILIIENVFRKSLEKVMDEGGLTKEVMDRVFSREIDPYLGAELLMEQRLSEALKLQKSSK